MGAGPRTIYGSVVSHNKDKPIFNAHCTYAECSITTAPETTSS